MIARMTNLFKTLFSKTKPREWSYGPYQPNNGSEHLLEQGAFSEYGPCVFCAKCAANCPAGALQVTGDALKKTWSVNHYQCARCGSCIETCPNQSISINHGTSVLAVPLIGQSPTMDSAPNPQSTQARELSKELTLEQLVHDMKDEMVDFVR